MAQQVRQRRGIPDEVASEARKLARAGFNGKAIIAELQAKVGPDGKRRWPDAVLPRLRTAQDIARENRDSPEEMWRFGALEPRQEALLFEVLGHIYAQGAIPLLPVTEARWIVRLVETFPDMTWPVVVDVAELLEATERGRTTVNGLDEWLALGGWSESAVARRFYLDMVTMNGRRDAPDKRLIQTMLWLDPDDDERQRIYDFLGWGPAGNADDFATDEGMRALLARQDAARAANGNA